MVIQVSIVVATAAFVILVLCFAITLYVVCARLKQMERVLREVSCHFAGIGDHTKQMIFQAKQLTVDLQLKMGRLDSLFKSIEDAGDLLEYQTHSLKRKWVTLSPTSRRAEEGKIKIAEILELAIHAISLWQKIKTRS